MADSWASGSTRAWRRVRAAVLRRDGYRCRAHADGWCDRAGRPGPHRCTGLATHAHHVRGRARTGDDPAHIVASCSTCNLHIGEPTEPKGDPECRPMTRWA